MTIDPVPPLGADVIAVVVTYHPNSDSLGALLRALAPQTESVVVVDNGSQQDVGGQLDAMGHPNVTFVPLGKNLGIAAAHNAGIRWARKKGAKYVLLMDQDSVPDAEMVAYLLAAHESLVASGKKVAAVGPRFRDSSSGYISHHVRFGRTHIARVDCAPGQEVVLTDFLISSGSLISVDVLDIVGEMDEPLFIDHVDTEWVLRARAKGYMAWGHCYAVMTHSLGESRRRVWFGRWREIPFHKPFRYYYIFRNSVLLQRRDYACSAWRRVDTIRLLQLCVFMTLFHPQRFKALHMMLRGLRDGLRMSQ
ncbi:glycosyltransferase family 2 protein [Paraburkholderia caribensis]|uniref:glycosyltransferase family 2 protein n=1 Tax=Paraburkholderia caribensis TaxID=75105 RepID=UPI001CB423D2|nr:glycosyltransferase family 2 protein [Paraburkholderia caribensis]CAG9268002.1 dTDP-rhamnosyl transferase RfbF [Paraburkholderia caribensis]